MYDPFYDSGIDMWYVWGGDNDQTGPHEDVDTLIVTETYSPPPENSIYINSIIEWQWLLDALYAGNGNPGTEGDGGSQSDGDSDSCSAEAGTGNSVVYTNGDGSQTTREDGSRSWRNNNPGNIIASAFADSQGAIGDAGGFAVFPDEATGRSAMESLLLGSSYRDLSIEDAIARYSPESDGNDVDAYVTSITDQTGLQRTETIASMTDSEFQDLVDAMINHEGWQEGSETTTQGSHSCD